jgi:DNA-directed RNA polymerase specialized sigma24 family protein
VTPQPKTVQELNAAVERLSAADLLRLRSAARFLVAGMGEKRRGETWEDLLQEAVLRSLTGARKWPADVDVRTFLIGTMRSIVSSWIKRSPEMVSEEDLQLRSDGDPALNLVAGATLLESIRGQLSADATDLKIFECMLMGLKGPETAERTGISLSQYQSAVKRIRRIIKRIEQPVAPSGMASAGVWPRMHKNKKE